MQKRFLFIMFIVVVSIASCGGRRKTAIVPGEYQILVGTSKGLYLWDKTQASVPLWIGGEVRKILKTAKGYYLLTSEGIVFSEDKNNFYRINKGLIYKTIKLYRDGKESFVKSVQDLKDIEVDPQNPNNLITCNKDGILYSTTAGRRWTFVKSPSQVSGIKSVAIFATPGKPSELNILLSHPFKGIYTGVIAKKIKWKRINTGLFEYSGGYEEIADIKLQIINTNIIVYAANNFFSHIYKMDWSLKKKSWTTIYGSSNITDVKPDLVESLVIHSNKIDFVSVDGIKSFDLTTRKIETSTTQDSLLKSVIRNVPLSNQVIEAICYERKGELKFNLSELWILAKEQHSQYVKKASNLKGLYTQAGNLRNPLALKKLTTLMKKVGLNMIVVDMKDDFGQLRFSPNSPIIKSKGKIVSPIDVEKFTADMKKQGIYTVARIVAFKDKNLYHHKNSKLAVKDKYNSKLWRGIKKVGTETNEVEYYREYWVDPYSVEVWEYVVEISRELIARGFDEIQFDYIRFPTDGKNLWRAGYPHKDKDMDRESLLMSFLNYARENIPAPISVDIYGANGWYRTGARTGQDVEMLKNYVDVICPMFYPSHFYQHFMAHNPAELRPYRIYNFGSYRNYWLAKKQIVVRPYVQVFKINVSYDRKYWGTNYLIKQVEGTDDAVDMGYTHWNAGSKYDILKKAYGIE